MTSRNRVATAVLASALLVSGAGHVQAQNKPDCPKGVVDIEGQVVKVDVAQGKVTVRGADGTTHEFQASKETLQDMKVGDKIAAADGRLQEELGLRRPEGAAMALRAPRMPKGGLQRLDESPVLGCDHLDVRRPGQCRAHAHALEEHAQAVAGERVEDRAKSERIRN
jgi:hypothetical protein